MHSNVPANELAKIIDLICTHNNIKEELKHEIKKISQILIRQKYFHFRDTLYLQEEGLTMGAPTSSTFYKIYIEHIKITKIVEILLVHHIVEYLFYVDDIFLAFKITQQTYMTSSICSTT
jgi:hypothetical protein